MEPRDTEVRLPIAQILNSNLAWVRRDVTSDISKNLDDDLTRSLQVEGMKLPILLTPDLVVADGARRLMRARALGWREVPVTITSDWDVVRAHYAKARELEAQGEPHMPMSWGELIDLIHGPINELYNRRRLERGRETRARNQKLRAQGLAIPPQQKHDFIGDVAEALGWRRGDLRSIREITWTLNSIRLREERQRKIAANAKELAATTDHASVLEARFLRLEETGGGVEGGLYTLLRMVREVAAGKDPGQIKTARAKRSIGEPTYAERKAKTREKLEQRELETPDVPQGRELDAATITNITKLLVNVGHEARAYTHVRPSVMPADAVQAVKEIRSAVRHFNGLARVLKDYAELLEEKPA